MLNDGLWVLDGNWMLDNGWWMLVLDGGRVGNYVGQGLCTLVSGVRSEQGAQCFAPLSEQGRG